MRPLSVTKELHDELLEYEEEEEDSEKGNRDYMGWIRKQRCVSCYVRGVQQQHHTQAHHISKESLVKKCPDLWTVPLCEDCHILTGFHRSQHIFLSSLGMTERGLHEYALGYLAFHFSANSKEFRKTDKKQIAWAYNRLLRYLDQFEDEDA